MIVWVKVFTCVLGGIFIIVFAISCCSRESRIDRVLKDLKEREFDKKLDDIIELEKTRKRGQLR